VPKPKRIYVLKETISCECAILNVAIPIKLLSLGEPSGRSPMPVHG
jgi:hypothetical protein